MDKNHFCTSEEALWTKTESVQELETAIQKCKESILSLEQTSEEKRLLVQNLVKLRLKLQDVQEIEIYTDLKKVKMIHHHKFVKQTVGQIKFKTSQLYCETCVALIWIPIQTWFCCSGKNLIHFWPFLIHLYPYSTIKLDIVFFKLLYSLISRHKSPKAPEISFKGHEISQSQFWLSKNPMIYFKTKDGYLYVCMG